MKRKRSALDVASSIQAKRGRKTYLAPRIVRPGGYKPPRAIAQERTGGYTGIERKFVNYTNTADAFTTIWAAGEMDPTSDSISAIAVGTNESQRIGRVATLTSWFIKGYMQIAVVEGSITPLPDIIARIAVVLDTQTNGAQLEAETVFGTIGAGLDVNSVKDLQNSKRYTVLKDKTFTLRRNQTNEGSANLFANGIIRLPFKMGGKLRTPLRVNHTGTTAAIASIADNSLHVIGTATDTAVILNYRSRVRYIG